MTASEFRAAAIRAFDDRDREALERAIRAFAEPEYEILTQERLRRHRAEAAERLNHLDAEIQRRKT